MNNTSSTYLGKVVGVTGSAISIYLSPNISSGLAIIDGATYKIGQVGSFVRIPQGYKDLYAIVCEVGAEDPSTKQAETSKQSGRWITAQLVGETVGASFERGIGQYPNIDDEVHLVTEKDLQNVYGIESEGHIPIGRLSSAENIIARIKLDKLVTRHSAVLGSTGSGKSTTVASLLRSITIPSKDSPNLPSARILLLDIHGEYSNALSDVSRVFRINPSSDELKLAVPFWALEAEEITTFLFGGLRDGRELIVFDKIIELKIESAKLNRFDGIVVNSITADTPVPYSLKRLWYELIDPELKTFENSERSIPAIVEEGSADLLIAPRYKPAGLGSRGPFLPTGVPGIRRQLQTLRSRLLERQYDFLLHPDDWEPDLNGRTKKDLPELLESWLGHDKPITILDLSGVPSTVLVRLIGAILRIVYSALFWSREKSEGGLDRPLLVVMEEAHRYLNASGSDNAASSTHNSASAMVQQIVKEGRKYGVGAMIISQRPTEVDETVLSQCGTFFGLRLSNPLDRAKVKGTLPDSLAGLMDMLPILRTGELIVTGEAATLPIRCRVSLPEIPPDSRDPEVYKKWSLPRKLPDRVKGTYRRMSESWRAQLPRQTNKRVRLTKVPDKES